MLTLDLTPITSRLDKIIELLTNTLPRPPPLPIQQPNPLPSPPPSNLIVFENEDEQPEPIQPELQEPLLEPGWAICTYNPAFEIQIDNNHFIRHKETKEMMTIQYDLELYPIPHFEKATFETKDYPKRMAYIVALNFLPNPNQYRFLTYKDNNPYNFNFQNLVWCENYPTYNTIGPGLPEDVVYDPSFHLLNTITENQFYNHPIMIYQNTIYQAIEKQRGTYYRECFQINNEAIIITDNNDQLLIPLSEINA
jgi:hypothetical protein